MRIIVGIVVGLATASVVFGQAVGKGQEKDPTFWDRTASEWVVRLGDADAEVRAKAAFALEMMRPSGQAAAVVVPALTRALEDSNDEVRMWSAFALGKIGPAAKPAVAPLIAALEDEDGGVRHAAAAALGGIGHADAKVVAALARALGDEDEHVQEAAVVALGRLGPDAESAVGRLIETFASESVSSDEIADALGRIGRASLEPLKEALQDAARPEAVRRGAAEALARFGSDGADPLAAAVFDASPSVRQRAVESLGALGAVTAQVVPVLIEALKDRERDVRVAAVGALERCGAEAKDAIPALVAALRDEDELVASRAAGALGSTRHELGAVMPELIATLNDRQRDAAVRSRIAEALGEAGQPARGAVRALVGALEGPSISLREQAARALGRIGSDAELVVPALVQQLKDERVAWWAASALGAFGDRAAEAVPALIEALESEDGLVRGASAEALGRIGPAAAPAVPALVARLDDRAQADDEVTIFGRHNLEVPVGTEAARTLFRVGPRGVVSLLRALQEDRHRSTVALMALADTWPAGARQWHHFEADESDDAMDGSADGGAPPATLPINDETTAGIETLIAILHNDPERNNRVYAARALAKLGPAARAAVRELAQELRADDPEIRAAAAQALGELGLVAAEAVPALAKALEDGDESGSWVSHFGWQFPVRMHAAEALGKIGAPAATAVPALQARLSDEDGVVRVAAALAIGRIQPAELRYRATLIVALGERNDDPGDVMGMIVSAEVRSRAVQAMGELTPHIEPPIAALSKSLKDEDGSVRWSAADAMGAFGPAAAEAAPGLVTLLVDNDEDYASEIRAAAMRALGRLGPEAVPHLTAALEHPRMPVRAGAASALGRMGPAAEAATAALGAAQDDEYLTVQHAVRQALRMIRGSP